MKSRHPEKKRGSLPCSAETVAALCRQAGFTLTENQAGQWADFLELLMRWNKAMNLVGAQDWQQALIDLFMDSLWLERFFQENIMPLSGGERAQIWDLGAGAGLPGIPLRLIWTEGYYTLVEAREKRALFLATALARLRPARTEIFRGRAETFMQGRKADIILSRAFRPWREVLALVRDHLNPGGKVILLTAEAITAPDGWQNVARLAYPAGKNTRYLGAFAGLPTNAPS